MHLEEAMPTDGAGHRYVEFAMYDEKVRVTLIPGDAPRQEWMQDDGVRIQKVQSDGRLVQGIQLPKHLIGELAKALHDVVSGEK
jgi:hypothetical protein